MMISIIVPTLNEELYLPILLESIQKQNHKNIEVIIADANSTDKTRSVAIQAGAKIVEGGIPAVGRNNGAKIAKGDFLFFLDADVKLPDNFFREALKEIDERFLDLATCDFIPLSDLRFDKVLHNFTNLFIKINQFTPTPHSGGACIIVSKRLFDKVHGFDESLKLSEDHDFVQRASIYRPLRVLRNTTVKLSIRRLEKEGRLSLIKKYTLSELTNLTRGLIPNIQDYEFAKYDEIKTKNFDEKLINFEQNLDTLNKKYNSILKRNQKKDPFEKEDETERTDLKNVKFELQNEIKKFVELFRKIDR